MASLLEELLQPIAPESFCGEDATYESEFETAKAEAEKLSENNWTVMEEAAHKLLTTKSKDMRVLGFLALSTALTKGLTPFAEAVQAYVKLVMEHWEDIHPKRPNGRANALRWLNEERVLFLLSGLGKARGDYEALKAAAEGLQQLQTFCDGKFPGGSPPFVGFAKIVRQFADNNQPRAEPTQAETAAAAENSTQPAAGGGVPAALASFDDCLAALQNVAGFLLGQDPTSALGYRLTRLALWSGITGNLPSEDGITLLPPPYASTMEGFRNFFQQSQWVELVKSGEEMQGADGMFLWLDLQRFICTALKGLGGNHAACAKAVMQELAQMLLHAPSLPDLKFNDGTPFADSMTKEWIEAEVKPSLGGGGGGGGLPAIKKKGDVGEEQKQAFSLLEEGKLAEALNVLRTGLANDSSRKNNFDRKLLLADLCYKGNKAHISHALLGELREQIQHHDLENWDPESCLQVYRLTQKVCSALADSAGEAAPSLRTLALEAHIKISRLDAVAAFQTDPPA